MSLLFETETYKIIGACMEVHSKLGPGFLEAVYQEALEKEFDKNEIPYKRQVKLELYYDDAKLNKYYIADFVCYDQIIIELKASSFIHKDHEAQVLNYLKATDYEVGLLVNFGQHSLTWKRSINSRTT